MSSESSLLFERQGGVATLTLNRPEARNALTTGLFLEMERALLDVEADDAVRAVVPTGSGRANLPFEGLLDFEARNQRAVSRSDDVKEGVRAFLERRKPEFRGR